MPDIAAVQAAVKRAATQRGPSPAEAAALQQTRALVGMRMDLLLNGDGWDVYRAHVESLRADAQTALDAERDRVETAGLVGDEAARAVLRATVLRDRVETYTRVLGLPQFLVQQAGNGDASPLGPAGLGRAGQDLAGQG